MASSLVKFMLPIDCFDRILKMLQCQRMVNVAMSILLLPRVVNAARFEYNVTINDAFILNAAITCNIRYILNAAKDDFVLVIENLSAACKNLMLLVTWFWLKTSNGMTHDEIYWKLASQQKVDTRYEKVKTVSFVKY
ncbi:hypothetical protein Tco_0363631 [Tanacetum coccineum]